MPCRGSPGHPVMLLRDVGLGSGVRVGWTGAGSSSLGNGRSQFPPIDVAARAGRAGRAPGLHKRQAGTAPSPGRCACEAMARLTGTRPVAARRWGCAATAFLLLLLTVQAGKGGRGGGRRGGDPVPWVPLPSPGAEVGLGCGTGVQRCPWEAEHGSPAAVVAPGEGWMRLLDVLCLTVPREVPGVRAALCSPPPKGRLGAAGSAVRHRRARGSRSPSPSPLSRA